MLFLCFKLKTWQNLGLCANRIPRNNHGLRIITTNQTACILMSGRKNMTQMVMVCSLRTEARTNAIKSVIGGLDCSKHFALKNEDRSLEEETHIGFG